MPRFVPISAIRLVAIPLALALGLAACAGGTGTSVGDDGAGPSVAASDAPSQPAPSTGGPPASLAEINVTGTLTSSGEYDGTWTWVPGNAAEPSQGGISLISKTSDYGNITVTADGSISFNSGVADLVAFTPFNGTGAQVVISNGVACAFTLDSDLTGSENKIIHFEGTMTITGGAYC